MKIYKVGDITETCGTPACISLGVDILPSTETLHFLLERKETISPIKLVENCNPDNLYRKPRCSVVSKDFFDIQEYRSRRHIVVEI
jgi:hypothetical protein